jgi:hypothetical protein
VDLANIIAQEIYAELQSLEIPKAVAI